MEQAITQCQAVHSSVLRTFLHCTSLGGKHVTTEHLRLLMDCQQITATAADFMLRKSPLHHLTCGACAEVCERMAKDLESIDKNDKAMMASAEECLKCAQLCREMSQQKQS